MTTCGTCGGAVLADGWDDLVCTACGRYAEHPSTPPPPARGAPTASLSSAPALDTGLDTEAPDNGAAQGRNQAPAVDTGPDTTARRRPTKHATSRTRRAKREAARKRRANRTPEQREVELARRRERRAALPAPIRAAARRVQAQAERERMANLTLAERDAYTARVRARWHRMTPAQRDRYNQRRTERNADRREELNAQARANHAKNRESRNARRAELKAALSPEALAARRAAARDATARYRARKRAALENENRPPTDLQEAGLSLTVGYAPPQP